MDAALQQVLGIAKKRLSKEALNLFQEPCGEAARVQVCAPVVGADTFNASVTAVEARISDRPFVVDSIKECLRHRALEVHLNVHPVLGVVRDGDGRLSALTAGAASARREAYVYIHCDRLATEKEQTDLRRDLLEVLQMVAAAVDDYAPMQAVVREVANDLLERPGCYPDDRSTCTQKNEFLTWLLDGNFTFLGARRLASDSRGVRAIKNSQLGLLRTDRCPAAFVKQLESELARNVEEALGRACPLAVARTNARSPVHRAEAMDCVSILKRSKSGQAEELLQVIGLFTTVALEERVGRIPLLRLKVAEVLDRLGYLDNSYSRKKAVAILDTLPKEFLFNWTAEELHEELDGLMGDEDDDEVFVAIRRRPEQQRLTLTIQMPESAYSVAARNKVVAHVRTALRPEALREFRSSSEPEQTRLHIYLFRPQGGADAEALTRLSSELRELLLPWHARLTYGLKARFDGATAREMAHKYASAFPETYRTTYSIETALYDVEKLEELQGGAELVANVLPVRRPETGELVSGVRLYKREKMPLSVVMPALSNLGLCVIEERATDVNLGPSGQSTIHSFGVTDGRGRQIPVERMGALAEALTQILLGLAENDPAAGLVLDGGLAWRQVEALITYRNLMQQCNRTYSVAGVNEALLKYPAAAASLFRLFTCKFDPELTGDRAAAVDAARAEFLKHLEKVDSINADKVLRTLAEFIEATVRTNYFLARDPESAAIAIKIVSRQISVMPHPRPLFEIYVHGPGVEACHLRGGKVARGGLRWSDRPDDFRTEILGLMNTQMVKNSVIVPVGSKGGFVLKRRFPSREQQGQEMVKQYKVFMRSLLDITDNMVRGKVVHPKYVVCHDEPDPYLVVAADKGTAHMSDTANSVSKEYGFWLGDAFASGGSAGYSHKDMGITAKGAWVCVSRLFREAGVDLDRTAVTCVGIGDMSGDVFGNGMLLSRKLKLVAAFDHRHIFIDPDPDPEKSYKERERLFELPASSWLDYRRELMSKGGGIYNRGDKKITLSAEARARLGIAATSVNGDELVRAILKADVDLLWNGGIGTYIKASNESHLEVGDKANDELRVNAAEVRAKVIGEGGNLGMTPLGRIEFLGHGGRCSTDAIDNSAGVDCSDHEVNLKILMKLLIDEKLVKDDAERDKILPAFTARVEKHVLNNNYLQSALLSMDEMRSREDVESFITVINDLVKRGFIDRDKMKLPADDELRARFAHGEPIPRSVLASLTGWVKMVTYDTLLASDLPDLDYFKRIFVDYFPPGVVQRYGDVCWKHHLRREIIATYLTNQVVNQAGISFFARLRAEEGQAVRNAVYIYSLINDLLEGDRLRAAIHALDNKVAAKAQYEQTLALESVIFPTCQRILRAGSHNKYNPEVIARVSPEVRQLIRKLGDRMSPRIKADLATREKELLDQGFPKELSRELSALAYLDPLMTIVRIHEATDAPLDQVAGLWYLIGDQLFIHFLSETIAKVRMRDDWDRQWFDSVSRDLVRYHRELTTRVLRDRREKETVAQSLERLIKRKTEAYDRLEAGVLRLKAGNVSALVPVQVLKENYEEMLAK